MGAVPAGCVHRPQVRRRKGGAAGAYWPKEVRSATPAPCSRLRDSLDLAAAQPETGAMQLTTGGCVLLGAVGGAMIGLLISNQSDAGVVPLLYCGAIGAGVGLVGAFVLRLARIGNKALTRLERKLDEPDPPKAPD